MIRVTDDKPLQRSPRSRPERAPLTGTKADMIRLDVECTSCHHRRKHPLRELAANNKVTCAFCRKPIDLSTPEWRARIAEATTDSGHIADIRS
jgi:hypothetical protein